MMWSGMRGVSVCDEGDEGDEERDRDDVDIV